jgi:hypothetical protein
MDSTSKPSFYDDPKLSSFITHKHAEYFQSARLLGQAHGTKNLPRSDEPHFAHNISSIVANYNSVLAENHIRMQAHMEIELGTRDLEQLKHEKEAAMRKHDVLIAENNILAEKLNSGSSSMLKLLLGIVLVIGIGTGEILLTTSAFQILGNGMGSSILMAAGLTIALIAVTHLIPLYIARIRSIWGRKLAILCLSVSLLILVSGLAHFRDLYLQRINGSNSGTSSQLWFIVINILMVIALYGTAVHLVLPSWQSVSEAFKRVVLKIRILLGKRKIHHLEKKMQYDKEDVDLNLRNRLQKIGFAKANEERIYRNYLQAVAAYCDSNYERRPDGILPKCFSMEPPKLNFFYSDINFAKTIAS